MSMQFAHRVAYISKLVHVLTESSPYNICARSTYSNLFARHIHTCHRGCEEVRACLDCLDSANIYHNTHTHTHILSEPYPTTISTTHDKKVRNRFVCSFHACAALFSTPPRTRKGRCCVANSPIHQSARYTNRAYVKKTCLAFMWCGADAYVMCDEFFKVLCTLV